VTLKPYPEPIDETLRADGQQREYRILSAEERAKGFVRPVRLSYVHVGIPGPEFPLRDLTAAERELYGDRYAKFEEYPEEKSPATGRFWTAEGLAKIGKGGCRTKTTMARELAETYAREPRFYSGTFCCGCGVHLPVGERGEFVWDGTNERVGT